MKYGKYRTLTNETSHLDNMKTNVTQRLDIFFSLLYDSLQLRFYFLFFSIVPVEINIISYNLA